MNQKRDVMKSFDAELKNLSEENGVDFEFLQKLLKLEKEKKMLKRRFNIQQTIKSEIEKIYGVL
ncbi:hypothetical protein QUF90_23110 [Desulfococcaceae bacterium HSG9]|nr:hypothetical protein [Desulfococcaceae bacterium HSG9]